LNYDQSQSRPVAALWAAGIDNKAGGPMSYELHTEFSEVVTIGAEWDELLTRSRCNSAFGCSKWFMAAPALFPELRALVIVGRRSSRIAGILPLVVDVRSRKAGFANDFSDYRDVICEDGDLAVVTGLLEVALSGAGPWSYDALALKSLRLDSNILRTIQMLEGRPGGERLSITRSSYLYGYVDLSRGYGEYLRTLSRNFRHNLNRVRNKAERHGLVVRELTTIDIEPAQLPETFFSLHLRRIGPETVYKSAGQWINVLLPSLFAERRLRVFAVLNRERIVALHLAMTGSKTLFGWNGGFLKDHESFAPGRLLYDEVMRQSAAEGREEYDFGCWDGLEYKDAWKLAPREVFELEIATSSVSNSADIAPLEGNSNDSDAEVCMI